MQRSPAAEEGLRYWLRWQVPVCASIIILPTAVSIRFIIRNSRKHRDELKLRDLWMPCWTNLHPLWLLFYRLFSFVSMSYLLYQTVQAFGAFVFYFFTQWTFVLVTFYFALGTVISAQGCLMHFKEPLHPKKDSDLTQFDQKAGFLGNLMQNVYQACAGAVMLTDIVFWCLLLPFQTSEHFKLTLLIGLMHSANAVFLLLDSALNSLQFPWHRLAYFVLWSSSYVTFQWVMHACGFTWWPYPFLELATPWAPMWYLGIGLVHLPCYGVYLWLVKMKVSMSSKMFPQAFRRDGAERKQA